MQAVKKIKAADLEQAGACQEQVDLFRQTFGEEAEVGIPVTQDSLNRMGGAGLDVKWLIEVFRLSGIEYQWDGTGGMVLERHWRHGLRHGVERRWYPSGVLHYEGHLEDGKHHGTWRFYDPDGSLCREEEWCRGRLHGAVRNWYSDGSRWEIHYRYGELHGLERRWHPDGTLAYCREWQHGDLREEEDREAQ